ncbi:hypothetical protein BC830DRAFT_629350 [Chytriomyces sp. MP71]|nr:hypothetical protein BC830DRAFT_629350 [Chytriomyces sp. MP71]
MFSISSIRQRGGAVHVPVPVSQQFKAEFHDATSKPSAPLVLAHHNSIQSPHMKLSTMNTTVFHRETLPSLTSHLHTQTAHLPVFEGPIVNPESLIPPHVHPTPTSVLLQQARIASDKRAPVDARERTLRRRDARARRQAQGLAKPPNAFILFRRDCAEQLRTRSKREGLKLTDISKVIAGLWNQATLEVRGAYQLRANIMREAHIKMHGTKYKDQQSAKKTVSRILEEVVAGVSGTSMPSSGHCADTFGIESSAPLLPCIDAMVPFSFNC